MREAAGSLFRDETDCFCVMRLYLEDINASTIGEKVCAQYNAEEFSLVMGSTHSVMALSISTDSVVSLSPPKTDLQTFQNAKPTTRTHREAIRHKELQKSEHPRKAQNP